MNWWTVPALLDVELLGILIECAEEVNDSDGQGREDAAAEAP